MNIGHIKKKSKNTEYLGCRVDRDTKQWCEDFCDKNDITVSGLMAELIKEFRLKNDIKSS